MSRHAYALVDDSPCIIWIGWDQPMGTFFLHLLDGGRKPLVWEGARPNQYTDPAPLVALAERLAAEHEMDVIASDILGTLESDKAAGR
ncbi:MAG: hypothetical protein DI605_14935 [Sphingomonas sp.]|nr:MAG: hypothetical protein DI605_14935 [Sphingomonas sp.]